MGAGTILKGRVAGDISDETLYNCSLKDVRTIFGTAEKDYPQLPHTEVVDLIKDYTTKTRNAVPTELICDFIKMTSEHGDGVVAAESNGWYLISSSSVVTKDYCTVEFELYKKNSSA